MWYSICESGCVECEEINCDHINQTPNIYFHDENLSSYKHRSARIHADVPATLPMTSTTTTATTMTMTTTDHDDDDDGMMTWSQPHDPRPPSDVCGPTGTLCEFI
jgi:hypothetical protein